MLAARPTPGCASSHAHSLPREAKTRTSVHATPHLQLTSLVDSVAQHRRHCACVVVRDGSVRQPATPAPPAAAGLRTSRSLEPGACRRPRCGLPGSILSTVIRVIVGSSFDPGPPDKGLYWNSLPFGQFLRIRMGSHLRIYKDSPNSTGDRI